MTITTIKIQNNGPHHDLEVNLADGYVYVLVGKNGSGKSQLLRGLKAVQSRSILLSGSYEQVEDITTATKSQTNENQIRSNTPVSVSSLVAADPILFKIFQYYFKILFDSELTIVANNFKIRGFNMNQEADGFKAIFNLLYYLVSDHKMIFLDEPERFFHPSMKAVFISLLSEIAKNYNKVIVITSHSDQSIRMDLENVNVWLIRQPILKVNDWLNTITDIVYTSQKDKAQFKDWLTYHSEVFFSNSNCLVEGVSDQVILHAIKNKMALKYNLEHISISHVAASNHEAGGKSRLHKFQKFLEQLNTTFVIADKDVIPGDVRKWFIPVVGDTEPNIIRNAIHHKLHILSKGEIEDYYFIDGAYDYCSSIAKAKANKISAAYEQARIIAQETINEVEAQYQEVVNILRIYSTLGSADEILKSLSKDYLIDKYARGDTSHTHISDEVNGDEIDLKFQFAGHGKGMKFPKDSLEKIMDLEKEIDNNLK